MKKYTMLSLAVAGLLAVTSASQAATLFFDFGDGAPTHASDPSSNYNSILVAPVDPNNLIILNAIDSTGAGTGITVQAAGFYSGSNTNGTTAPTGDAAIFNVQATRDNAFGHALAFGSAPLTPQATVQFGGLDASGNTAYNFTIFASRMGVTDNRETQYDLQGANSVTTFLNASANTSEVATASGIIPNANGEITMTLMPGPNNNNGSKFYYLGALRLESANVVIPEPATCGLLMLCALAIVSRRTLR